MTKNPVSLDKWRDYFSSANSDIFCIIEHAIMVAASDCPYDFKVKRDRIAEMLFTPKLTKCLRCHRTELYDNCLKGVDGEFKTGVVAGRIKDSKVNIISRDEDGDYDDHNAKNGVCDQDYEDAEALTAEIEEESQFLAEVLRIKEVVEDREGKSGEVLFESLRRLQLMPLSVEILKETEIGKSVNALRKHGSKEIRNLVRRLVEDWKLMVDAWVSATTAIAGSDFTTESGKTSGIEEEEEEGLPSPPLDEGAFLATPTSMELSQFFDGMDDDGNLRNCGEFNKNRQNGSTRKPERTGNSRNPNDSRTDLNLKNQESRMKNQSPPCRPKPPSSEMGVRRLNNIDKARQNDTLQKKPLPQQQEKLNPVDKKRLEDAKRKLHDRYQEAENAKKQRTIQVVELHDLPKQSRNLIGNNHFRERLKGRW